MTQNVTVESKEDAGVRVVSAKSANYGLSISDGTILADATGGAFTLTLPAAAGSINKIFNLIKIDASANAVTIDGDGGEFIDGVTTTTLDRRFQSVQIQSDGTSWFTISGRHMIDSVVRLHTGNGYGSSNTKIKRFTTVVENLGNAITYADSATDGSSFTINEKSVYHISYTSSASAASTGGLSVNSAELTTNMSSLTNVVDRLASETHGGAQYTTSLAWAGVLYQGDIVRPHNDGSSGTGSRESFTITKIGRL